VKRLFSLSLLGQWHEVKRVPVIARSASDEAISAENKDCFAPLAMTPLLNFTALPF
jgi:hypothetical protein